jgi:DNA-directed RNA polymerase specialized sigma24 family protein
MGDAVPDGNDLNSLILESLTGNRRAVAQLFKPARRYAMPVIAARAGDLPVDLHDDVFQEALALLLAADSNAYDPTRGSPRQFFRLLLINAIRRVRVGFTPPGQQTRQRGKPPVPADAVPSVVPLELAAAVADTRAIEAFSSAEARIDVDLVLGSAPPVAAQGLRLVYLQEMSLQDAGRSLGLSRFALRREIVAFAPAWKMAA